MLRTTTLMAGLFMATIAIAAAHIPARYAGPFPDAGDFKNITGVFAGTSLTLKGAFIRGASFTPGTGSFKCARTSNTQTRCKGRLQAETGRSTLSTLTITWNNGVPVSMTKTGSLM